MNVLVIEDEVLVAEFTKRALVAEGYKVSVISNGATGFKRAQSYVYDAIVLDISLPDKDGISICNELRRSKVMTPILILTCDTLEQTKVLGLDSGADDYMVKPFSHLELAARLRAITRRPSVILQSRLQVGDLILDPQEHTVSRAGNIIKLRPKEYDLLEFMMRNPGVALPKHVLLNKVWHIYSVAASNRLEVYIRQLRQKVDEPYDRKLIQTVRGVGYKLTIY